MKLATYIRRAFAARYDTAVSIDRHGFITPNAKGLWPSHIDNWRVDVDPETGNRLLYCGLAVFFKFGPEH